MNGKPLVVVLGALALVAILAFTVFDAGSLFSGSSGSGDGDGAGNGMDADGDDGLSGSSGAGSNRGAALFGRGTRRTGNGDALGRVLNFETKKPVEGATLTLTGTGYGDERVSVKTTTGADGRFHLSKVAAGEDFQLAIVSTAAGKRTMRGLGVAAGKVEDFGTIWLGEHGVLEGRVIDTLDQPVAGAIVQVHPGPMSFEEMMTDFAELLSRLDRDPEPIAAGKSGADGRFRIAGVPPGPATIVVRMPGYELAVKSITMSKDGVVGGALVIQLNEGTPITGRVVNQDGRGIPEARVALLDQGDTELGFYARQFSITDSRGNFEITSPPNASRLAAVVAADEYPTLVNNFTADQRDGLVFVLVGGASLQISLVDDATSEPIVGASLVAMLSDKPSFGTGGGNMLTAVTDDRGEAEIMARPGHLVMLMVSHAEHGRGIYSSQMMNVPGMGGAMIKGPDKSVIKPGQNRFDLRKPSGRVITGRVAGPDGPIAGATVRLGGQLMMFGGSQAVSDSEGTYKIVVPQLPTQMLNLAASAPGYIQPAEPVTFTFEKEGPTVVDLTLEHAAQIEGVVQGPGGEPMAGVAVRLKRDGGSNPMMDMFNRSMSGVTDGKGRYRFDTVNRSMKYHVVARHDGFVDVRTKGFSVGDAADVVTAPPLTLKRGLDIQVHVMEPGGRDVKAARVDVHVDRKDPVAWDAFGSWRSFAKVITNADGIATARAVPDGKVTLTARADGFAGARKTITVSLDSPLEAPVAIRLRESMKIAGRVVDENGRGVEDASIRMVATPVEADAPDADEQWTDSKSTESGPRGAFKITGASMMGSVRLMVSHEGYVSKTVTVRGRFEDFEIILRKLDPAVQRRREELTTELMEVSTALQAAKDDEERMELVERLQEIQREMQGLEPEAPGEDEVIEPGGG